MDRVSTSPPIFFFAARHCLTYDDTWLFDSRGTSALEDHMVGVNSCNAGSQLRPTEGNRVCGRWGGAAPGSYGSEGQLAPIHAMNTILILEMNEVVLISSCIGQILHVERIPDVACNRERMMPL